MIARKIKTKDDKLINTNLLKLVIKKFKGTHTNWLWIWNQFKAYIDSSDIAIANH